MITTCTHCNARYRLETAKVPERVIQVRCPGCQGVFKLDGTANRQESPVVGMVASAPAPDEAPIEGLETGMGQGFASPSRQAQEDSVVAADPFAAVADPEPVAPPAAQVESPAPESPRRRRRRSKEEMLARALVSDILVYNRDARDQALAEGNLVEAMSDEIKKSWELYKEKVTPEVASGTDCFRDALNEILAEGEKVF